VEIASPPNPLVDVGRTMYVVRNDRADDLSDDALLAGFAVGDPHAATEFVRRFQRRVFGLALRVVGDVAVADDVAQQTFERAWRHASTYDPARASVSTWLLSIARNAAIDETRRRRIVLVDTADLDTVSGDDDDPARAVVGADGFVRLSRLIDGLSREQRRAVVLAAWYGRTAAEIAKIEGIPLGTAKTRIRDGLLRVRATLRKQSSEEHEEGQR
jgi:RNA polymerase sigma factor (sigma-70 family)